MRLDKCVTPALYSGVVQATPRVIRRGTNYERSNFGADCA